MAYDLFLGIRKRYWARDPDLTKVPAAPAAPSSATRDLTQRARELDDKIKVRRAAGGAVVSTKWKWG